jgi:hypothetical protein
MDKTRTMMLTTFAVAIAGFVVLSQNARADEAMFDVDPKFRAKIVKEKAKQASQQAASAKKGNPDANCGSQNIGNVNTGGRIGTAPREVFVFAPNAINLVNGNGCN